MQYYIWEVSQEINILSRDGIYEVDVETCIAAGNKMNGTIAALLRWQKVSANARLAVYNVVLVPMLYIKDIGGSSHKIYEDSLESMYK